MNYINNEKLLKEIVIYKETGRKTENLGNMLLLLAKRYSERGSFAGYSWKDDMQCDAVLTCLKYMHNFDVNIDNPNPFAYFSRIIHNSFLNYIAKQKKHSTIKDICYKNLETIIPEVGYDDSDFSYFDVCGIDYQVIRGNKKKKKGKKKMEDRSRDKVV
jgi:DNA-directed RNA polymerase specialized sigma24 family protein